MSQIDELNASIAALQASFSDQLAAITDEIAQVVAGQPVDLSAQLQALADLKTGIDASTRSLRDDDPTPPSP